MDGHDGSEAINYTFASKYKDLYHGVLCDISDTQEHRLISRIGLIVFMYRRNVHKCRYEQANARNKS